MTNWRLIVIIIGAVAAAWVIAQVKTGISPPSTTSVRAATARPTLRIVLTKTQYQHGYVKLVGPPK